MTEREAKKATQDMIPEPSTERGVVTWITSDDGGGGPDEGLTIGLGNRQFFYAGYISKEMWEEHGSPLWPDHTGWWLVTGLEMIPMARFISPDDAKEFMDIMARVLQS